MYLAKRDAAPDQHCLQHGEPVAAVIKIDPQALEDYILANAPIYVADMEEADRDLAQGRTVRASDAFTDPQREQSPTRP